MVRGYTLKFLKGSSKIKPSVFFTIISSCFGLLILIVVPPFQSPDEINHFYRAYQISTGDFLPKKENNRIGGNIPNSLVALTQPYLGLRWNAAAKSNINVYFNQLSKELDAEDSQFVDFPNTALYSPVSYLSQSLSILLLRNAGCSPILIFYLTRLFTLIIWIIGIGYAIQLIPKYKWLFTLLALLPMSLFINMSISADVVTNILGFLLIAFILKINFENKYLSNSQYLKNFTLSILLALAKLVYTPLILLFLIIPRENFSSKKDFITKSTILFFSGFGIALLWSYFMSRYYIPYENYNALYRNDITLVDCANVHEQIDYIINNGFYIFKVLINSMLESFNMYFRGYIGTFGWLDTMLPIWLIITTYLVIFLTAIFEDRTIFSFSIRQNIFIIIALLSTLILVLVSQHLSWDCVGSDIIYTIQGRYFIPIFPLLFILFSQLKNKKIKINISNVVMLFSAFSLSFSIYVLLNRYY